jgi:hypothetical protein
VQSSFITEDRKKRNMLSLFSVSSVQLDNRKGVYNLWAFYLHTALLHQAFAHCGKFPILQNTDVSSGKEEAWAGGGGACLTPSRICLSYNLALQSRSTMIRREESFGARSEKIKDKSTVGEAEKMLLTAAEM